MNKSEEKINKKPPRPRIYRPFVKIFTTQQKVIKNK